MKVSLKWLKQYVDIDVDAQVLAERLTMVGLEVESVHRPGDAYRGFVVGEVISCEKHPKADRLTVCKVDTGGDPLQIVCGAPNVAAGQKVVVGLDGAVVPKNQHDPDGKPFTLSHVKLRGVDSYGMICSQYELGLGDDRDGIWVLPGDAGIGLTLEQYLGLDDTMFEVGVTPNRPDALSHIGIAREIGALLEKPLKLPGATVSESGEPASSMVEVIVDDIVNCPRYSARLLRNVTVGSSPDWLASLLEGVGIRPINNVVDVTNFVLMELGHPLHAFDYDLLRGHKIVVRSLSSAGKFNTLDGKERELPAGTLMICDGSGPVAVAGVMGGMNSEISDRTTTVLLESAYFSPGAIRKSSKSIGLSTDASQRFERGADPSATTYALDRAAGLLQQVAGATVVPGTIDVYPKPIQPQRISLSVKRLNAILGSSITRARAIELLAAIGIRSCDPSSTGPEHDACLFEVPTFRPDIEREIDLVEEIARLNGYENIVVTSSASVAISHESPAVDHSGDLAMWLVGRGFNQVVANSMQSRALASITSDNVVTVLNPLSSDMSALRTSLSTGILGIISGNIRHGSKDLRLFELGRVYSRVIEAGAESWVSGFREDERLGIAMTGNSTPVWWNSQIRNVDLFDLKGEVTSVLVKLGLDKFHFIPYSTTNALTQDGLTVEIQGRVAGWLGKVKQEVLKVFDIEQDVFTAELNVEVLVSSMNRQRKYKPLPVYPSVIRDLAIVVDESVPMSEILSEVQLSAGALLVGTELFDVYRGDQVPKGKKSCALALEFRSSDRTLSQDDADKAVKSIMEHISKKFNAALRA